MRASLVPLAACALATLGAAFAACSTSKGSPDPADGGDGSAVEAGVDEQPSATCPSQITCAFPADCARAQGDGGVPGCWTCAGGCCDPVAETMDPDKVCAPGGTACAPSTCDGRGGCTGPRVVHDGKPCGKLCGGVFVYGQATCVNGACVGDPRYQTACPQQCYGDYSPCERCDTSGCVAACAPIPKHPDRCFH
jgi:hypothetical protein